MPSDLDRAIAAQRRRLNALDADARRRMREAYGRTIARIEDELEVAVRLVEAYPGSEWRVMHEQRLRSLLGQVEAEYARFADDASAILRDAEVRAVSGGAQTAQELAAASGVPGVGMGVAVNVPAVERLVSSFAPGSPVRRVLDSYGTFGRKVIERELEAAIIGGKSPREASRIIRRTLGSGATKARVDTLARSSIMDAYRSSLGEQFQAMKRPGDRYRRVAAKSTRTCLACLARDGEITDGIPSDFHLNCRCIFHLVPAGVVLPYERGEDWLRGQPAAKVQPMFPASDAYRAWARGEVPLSAFVGVHRDPAWGDSIRVRSWREVKRRAA